jgi:hypothetical protein
VPLQGSTVLGAQGGGGASVGRGRRRGALLADLGDRFGGHRGQRDVLHHLAAGLADRVLGVLVHAFLPP